MAFLRTASAFLLAAALPLAGFVRNERSVGVPLFVAAPQAIEYRIHAGTAAGMRNLDGELIITPDSTPTAALLAALETWSRVEGSAVGFAAPLPEQDGTARPDGVNLITFADTPANRSITGGAIAVTRLFTERDGDGELLDTDVIFNPRLPFSTTLADETFDIQGALTHELGHALGMDHSGSATATMFATTVRGSTRLRTLSEDDRAFLKEVYPSEVPQETGAIEGIVRSPQGGVIIGAVVTAFEPDRNLAVSAITERDGRFRIPHLQPGAYGLIVEPLDGPAEVFQLSFLRRGAQASFRTLLQGGPRTPEQTSVVVNQTAQVELAVEAGAPVYNLMGLGAARPGEEPRTRIGAIVERGGVYQVSLHGEGLDDPAITLDSLHLLGQGIEILPTPFQQDRVTLSDGAQFPSLHFTLRVAADAPLGVVSLALSTSEDLAVFSSGLEIANPEPMPFFIGDAVVNAATYIPGSLAPGSLISIFGRDLAPTAAGAVLDPITGRLSDMLADTAVLLNGKPAPLLFVSPGQINLQAPVDLTPGQVIVTVQRNGRLSAPAAVEATSVAPGLFLNPNGGALAVLADGSLNGPGAPARRGEFLTLYGVGAGAVNPPLLSGELAGASPLSLVEGAVQVQVGGRPADVTFAGMTPGFAGLLQINFQVPDDAPAGDAVPLLVRVAGAAAPIRSIAVAP